MKRIISMALLGATTGLVAMQGQEAFLYKDPRIMGMGGANVAVGSYSTAVFSNPAGLVNIKKDHGIVVELLGVKVDATAQIQDFANDISDASDTGNQTDMLNVLQKYNGEHFHIGVDNYSSVSKNSDLFAWSIGILAAEDANFMTHAEGSAIGSSLETSSRVYGAIVLGAAKTYSTNIGRVDVGLGLKYVSQISYEGLVGIDVLTDDGDLVDKMRDTYEKKSSGFGVDLGVNYQPFPNNYWHPAIGLSVMNIGTLSLDDNYGGQPMTVNMGISISPEVSYIDKLVVAADYVDMFGANKQREYTSETGYIDHDTYDYLKKLRLGVGVGLFDNSWISTQVNLGLYQAAYTAGLDFQLTVLKLNFATYQEQIGVGSVDISDRRYMAQIGIGW